jgi:hypothetical protein
VKIHGSCSVYSSDPFIKQVVFSFKLNGSRVVNGLTRGSVLLALVFILNVGKYDI